MKATRVAAAAAAIVVAASPAAALDLQGHRGARGLAPENTLAGFATAMSIGVTTLELDVGLTADDVLVVAHDRRVSPDLAQLGGAYVAAPGPLLRSLTLAEVQRFDIGTMRPGSKYAAGFPHQKPVPGARIPTFDEVAELVRNAGDEVRLNVEIKVSPLEPDDTAPPQAFAERLVAALHRHGLEQRVTVQSFDLRPVRMVQRLAPEIATSCLTMERGGGATIQRGRAGASPWTDGLDVDDFGGSVPKLVQAAGCRIWSPQFRDLSPEALAEAHALGLRVVPWTVNEEADMTRLIEAGVDGIISDYPDRLRKAVAAKGLSLPKPVNP